MGAHKKAPFDLTFLKRQYASCQKKYFANDFYIHSMAWNGTSLIYRLFKYPVWACKFFLKFTFYSKKLEVIHVHFFFPTVILAILYKKLIYKNVKILVNFHGSDIYKYQKPNNLYRHSLKVIDGVIFASESLQNKLVIDFEQPSWVVPIGVDDTFKFFDTPKKYDLAFVGRLDQNKGIKRLVSALEKIESPLQVVVIGNGKFNSWLMENWPSQHELVRFDSLDTKDLAKLYRQSRYLISCSYNESYGLVMAEALSCGTPIIASETDGATTLVNNNVGYLIANTDSYSEQASHFIKEALALPSLEYQKLQYNCLNARHVMTSEQSATQFNAIYKEILNRK